MYAFQRFGTPLFPKYRRVSWNNKRFHPKAIFQAIAYSDKRGFIIFPVRVTRCVGRTSPLVKNYDKGGGGVFKPPWLIRQENYSATYRLGKYVYGGLVPLSASVNYWLGKSSVAGCKSRITISM